MRFIPPGSLVESLASMPYLDNISIALFSDTSFPTTMMEIPPTQITCVVLPRLSRFMFTGVDAYLENLLTRISAPFVQDLRFTISLKVTPTVVCLSAFLATIQNLNFQKAVMSFFPRCVAISFHSEEPSVVPPYSRFTIYSDDRDRAIASVAQICSAIESALSLVETLEIKLKSDYHHNRVQSGPFVQHELWRAFLRSFGSVKVLRADMALTAELSDALHPKNEAAVIKELLPKLSELVVVSWKDPVDQPFSSFTSARHLGGYFIDLRIVQDHTSSLRPPPISWSFDTF